ncbi:MAG TPA: hypothetical protein VHV81_11545 [Steroidobacteraceae bacterium]|jgi:hypothetical protein|nr:hypothetical protein [Steroidobacteraceae bacterium]
MLSTPWLAALGIAAAFCLSASQSFINRRIGSDHPVHVFLTSRIRKGGFRLFVRIPDLFNDCYVGAVPLYLHWIIAHFRVGALYWSERLLNPVLNALHVALLAAIAAFLCRHEAWPADLVGAAACLFALTPQFYHALSARNFGLSSRGIGLLLLTAFFFAAYCASFAPTISWIALPILGWLIWGFNTFGQQALCLLSVLLLILTGRWAPALGAALGLALFIALHPRYALGYLRHTVRFIRAYARSMAAIYILQRRHSIWRDLVLDIWRRFTEQGFAQGFRYAYENSVLVIVLLNPFTVAACWAAVRGADLRHGAFGYCVSLAVCGVIAAFLTSFRATRFLGEPERYVEVVTPWAVLAGAYLLHDRLGPAGLLGLGASFLLVDLLELGASRFLVSVVAPDNPHIEEIERRIEKRWGSGARVCSNNEHYTKMLMRNDWQYAYCLAIGNPYCGMSVEESFSRFPVLHAEAVRRIVGQYRINACLLDRKEYDKLFESTPAGLKNMTVAYETERFRLLFLEWE